MSSESIPIYSINETSEKSRFNEVGDYYEKCFQEKPEFYVRCPGRVNLIGEHVDYSGFPVLPIAIEQDIILAVGINETGKFKISNLEEQYKPCEISVDDHTIDKKFIQWYDYIFCGYKGIAEKFNLMKKNFNISMKGIIPPGSGLSSSSALVCAGALATCYMNRISISKLELAEICAASERFIGTEGGGMDQAIIFLAETGFAKLIQFDPLRAFNVSLPEDLSFIVAHSGTTMNKAATADFNIRVTECRLAAKVLAALNDSKWENIDKLCQIQEILHKDASKMIEMTKTCLSLQPMNRLNITNIMKVDSLEKVLKNNRLYEQIKNIESFKLGPRAYHVFKETGNVNAFMESCKVKSYENIGNILNYSHESLRDNYECSHPKLEALRDTMLNAGCLGAKLTGAGWGGCVVAAVKIDDAENAIEKIKMYLIKEGLGPDDVFLTKPSGGAAVYE